MDKLKFLILSILVLAGYSCKENKRKYREFPMPPIPFDVDSTRIGYPSEMNAGSIGFYCGKTNIAHSFHFSKKEIRTCSLMLFALHEEGLRKFACSWNNDSTLLYFQGTESSMRGICFRTDSNVVCIRVWGSNSKVASAYDSYFNRILSTEQMTRPDTLDMFERGIYDEKP